MNSCMTLHKNATTFPRNVIFDKYDKSSPEPHCLKWWHGVPWCPVITHGFPCIPVGVDFGPLVMRVSQSPIG